jgi:uncharacterized membrane protein YgcG
VSDLASHVIHDMPAEQILAINNDLSQMYMYPQNEPWILRNLTLCSFMRSDTLLPPASVAHDTFEPPVPWKLRMEKLWTDITDGWTKIAHRKRFESEPVRADQVAKVVQPLTLPQIFLVLTMYSARGWPCLVNFHMEHGPWNTHSFDVVPLSVHLGESREGIVWQDVSAAVAASVGHLRWSVWGWVDLFAARKCETYGVSVTSNYHNYQYDFKNNLEQSRKIWMSRLWVDLGLGWMEEERRAIEKEEREQRGGAEGGGYWGGGGRRRGGHGGGWADGGGCD